MLQVNEDNNDELFRRAAESYPLNTDNPDWENVLGKMNTQETAAETEPIKKKRKNYRFLLLLLLLIPVAIFENRRSAENTNTFSDKNIGSAKPVVTTKKTTIPDPQATASISTNTNHDQPLTQSDETIQSTDKKIPATTTTASTQTADQKNNKPGIASNNNPDNIVGTTGTTINSDNPIGTSNKRRHSSKQKTKLTVLSPKPEEDEIVTLNYPSKKEKKNGQTDLAINDQKEERASIKKETNSLDKSDIEETTKETASSKNTAKEESDSEKNIKKDSTAKETDKKIAKADDKTVKQADKKKKSTQKRFYVGAIAGPDFSAVKLQSVKKTGLGFGLLFGYQLTKKISVETGIIKDKKYYSTDGKYFTKGSSVPAYDKIEYVDGNCNMWEWAIKANYNFISKARSTWFASGGVSSYFMRHEDYVYDLNYNGFIYPKKYRYDNKSTSLFAAINISAGYTYKFGKVGDIRLEPYVKLPINKIGSGKLPVQSAGIYLGFTKNIF